jgi:type II secretion system protein J
MNRRMPVYGFTLVELLVAVAIFMLFMGATYGVFHGAYLAMTRTEEEQELYQTGRVLLAQLSAELASAYQPAGDEASALIGEDSDEASADLQQDRLTFLTSAHAVYGEAPAGDVCRVTYMLAEEEVDTPAGFYIEENPLPGLEPEEFEPVRHLLSPRVIGFNCKYLPAEEDWLTEWVDQPTLPAAVRVELVLRAVRPGAKPLVLATTTNLSMATVAEGASDARP